MINRTIVTGANGFIGSAVVQNLLKHHVDVLGLTREIKVDFYDYAEDNYSDQNTSRWIEIILKFQPKNVILCDWQGVFSKDRGEKIQFSNVKRWISIVEAAGSCGVENIVALGSQAEISALQDGVTEDEPFSPRSVYGSAKQDAFLALTHLAEQKNSNLIWARLFSVYGPKMSDDWFLKKMITAIKTEKDLETSELTQIWNFLHVDDCAQAIFSLLNNNSSGIYNVASESSVKLRDVADLIARLCGVEHKLQIGALPFRKDETFVMKPNIEKLINLGWKEEYSLQEGLMELLR